ncbi:hypothetical protein HPB48_005842 [Haemaphysalis longicornis]|uniref:Nuclear pore complex protein Nup88 n=1 Tax=Haemaphysalis longicornis TaxID=44386 RepID=A0A9J6GPW0_HAELO|nr:hypothetical protein HPB48_005842 [Haemaphysalis longicornis]
MSAARPHSLVVTQTLDSGDPHRTGNGAHFRFPRENSCCGSLVDIRCDVTCALQELLLSNPPLFEVDNVLVSCTKHLLLTGRHGITVVALPKTPAALLKETALCRLFDITEPHSAQLLLQVGVHHGTGGTLGASLGDLAASFDFGDMPPDGKARQVFVLMGSGDIYLTHVAPEDDNRSHQQPVLGPLTMLPQAEDNYGVDGYSLICLPAPVPLLAIATTGGTLYHCFALGTEDSFSHGGREDDEEVTLFVFEKIRLDLTFVQSDSEEEGFLCPIRLCKDPTDPQRYICLHNSGVHAVALPCIDKLQAFAGEEDLRRMCRRRRIVENLVCTRALASNRPAPPVGMAVIPCHPGPRLVVLTASWKLVIIALAPGHQSYMPELLSQSPRGALSSAQGDATGNGGGVLAHVQQMLAGRSLPQLAGAADDCTARQSLELLLSATQRIRDHWIPRLETCQLLIVRRAQAAAEQRDLQAEKLDALTKEMETLQKRNEALRQRYETVFATQQKLVKRVEDLLHRLQRQVPVLSLAEQAMARELKGIEEELQGFRELLEQARLKQHYQQQQQQEHGSGDREDVPPTVFCRRPARLTASQAQHIRAALKHE